MGSAGSSEWSGEGRRLPRVATETTVGATRSRRQRAAQRGRHSRGSEPPAPTHAAMPCSQADAVGRRVSVWWTVNEETGAGMLYDGKITTFDAATGELGVGSTKPSQHADSAGQRFICTLMPLHTAGTALLRLLDSAEGLIWA